MRLILTDQTKIKRKENPKHTKKNSFNQQNPNSRRKTNKKQQNPCMQQNPEPELATNLSQTLRWPSEIQTSSSSIDENRIWVSTIDENQSCDASTLVEESRLIRTRWTTRRCSWLDEEERDRCTKWLSNRWRWKGGTQSFKDDVEKEGAGKGKGYFYAAQKDHLHFIHPKN